MLETTLNQRLDLAKHVLSGVNDGGYCDVLGLHHHSMTVVERLIEVAGRPVGDRRRAAKMLTSAWMFYVDEHEAKGISVRLPSRAGVSVHFLGWAEGRLSGGWKSKGLLRLVKGSLARWREANPGVVPEAAGAGYYAV